VWRRDDQSRSCRARESLARGFAPELPGRFPERLRIRCHG
jgi:hypothetical protein